MVLGKLQIPLNCMAGFIRCCSYKPKKLENVYYLSINHSILTPFLNLHP